MKIAIVTHELSLTDGQGCVNYQISNYLANKGYQVTLIASRIDEELKHHQNITTHIVKLPGWLKGALFQNQFFAWKALHLLKQHCFDADIIHLNGSITYYPSDVNTAHFVHSDWIQSPFHPRRSRQGLNRYYQHLYTAINSAWEKQAYRQAQAVVAVSDIVKQSLIETCKTPAEQISVIPNGVDLQQFRPLAPGEANLLKQSIAVDDETFVAFFVGDIKSSRKNLDLVLKALEQLPETVHLAIAGSAKQSPYPQLAEALGLGERVHFLGHRSDVAQLMRGADTFVFPSHYETFGLVVLEALASGVPVITSPTVGSHTLIGPGKSGFVVDNHDLAAVLSAIQLLLGDADQRKRMAIAARNTAESHSWRRMAEAYENLYLDILQVKSRFQSDAALVAVER